ncbi:F-box/FBD/LRR-repeat protein At1g13570-like isoform X2 [Apium graveolens]|uniref:F-box/FBD/LRR-repeat protein At1g13570-like isoform X2 n=1 Tax=Apium graveolens TaxID=4045 RepID=UPI003D794480
MSLYRPICSAKSSRVVWFATFWNRKMGPIAKRRRIGEHLTRNDLISNLPVDLITYILERMPIEDAARTSILSKTWNNLWLSRSNIVLGKLFFDQLVSKQDVQSHQSIISEAVNKILLAQKGPIVKFSLFIPLNIDLRHCYRFWMSLLSRKGVEHLVLWNDRNNPVHTMPYDIFSFPELLHLRLLNCRLDPPPNYRGFCNLTLVCLIKVTLTADMSFGPQLNHLYLVQCLGIHHLGLQFTHDNKNLNKVVLYRERFLEVMDAVIDGKDIVSSIKECIDMHRFLSSTPDMDTLVLNSFCFRVMDPRRTIRMGAMEKMKNLVFYTVEFYDLHQILTALSLIRRSPNLQHLKISAASEAKREKPADLRVERYLESSNCWKFVLNQLHTVEIGMAVYSRAEFLFIKLLRACSPSLKNLRWHPHNVSLNFAGKGLV